MSLCYLQVLLDNGAHTLSLHRQLQLPTTFRYKCKGIFFSTEHLGLDSYYSQDAFYKPLREASCSSSPSQLHAKRAILSDHSKTSLTWEFVSPTWLAELADPKDTRLGSQSTPGLLSVSRIEIMVTSCIFDYYKVAWNGYFLVSIKTYCKRWIFLLTNKQIIPLWVCK